MSDTQSLPVMLKSLRLPSVQHHYQRVAHQAQSEEWSFERYLKELVELEMAERTDRRVERLLKRSELPDGKTLATLEQKVFPVKLRRQLPDLCEGAFLDRAENILIFGLPGRGKSHLAAAITRELIIHRGCPAYFTSSHRLVERLLVAKQRLELEKEFKRLDRFEVVVLDDIGYVQQSREEMEVLFTFLSHRYERHSVIITSNLVFSEWDKIFKDSMTTAAAIDRLVHHSVILELNNESYRVRVAKTQRNPDHSAPNQGGEDEQ
jgi:DNA replication protein DnaC